MRIPDPLAWLDRARQVAIAQWKEPTLADGTAVYIVDPAVRKQIRAYLTKEIWPSARAVLNSRGFDLLHADAPIIDDEWQSRACCSATLVVEDPTDPIVPGESARPWFCRMKVNCHANGVEMLHDELYLYVSMRTDVELLTNLLRETTHEGLPTKLFFEEPATGDPIWVVMFERGAGARQGRFGRLPVPEIICQRLSMYCDFIEIASELVGAPNTPRTYQKLAEQVNTLFENLEE